MEREVAVGQTWEECDPRFIRRVEIVGVEPSTGAGPTYREGVVTLRGIDRKGATRITKARLSRFNGKRGGYRYVAGASAK